ncbi:MAG TPA: peroxiredoxin [Thermoplasmata archaeon]|jgi:peroxiredoxin Q/BCP|nr:peroxiredoxin [Thermoplasmata archaeon]
MLDPGGTAPDFTAKDHEGNDFRLSGLRGTWVVLYFYPKDETVGCTAEACTFRDNLEAIQGLGAAVVGVSVQDVESHRQFAAHHRLNFRLVADPDKHVTRSYGALGILGVAKRVTYLIDPQGNIRDAYRSEINPTSHVEHARQRLRELGALAGAGPA